MLHPEIEQVCAIKIKGVTRQCITHKELANAPKVSGLSKMSFTIYYILRNSVANIMLHN